MVSPEAMKIAQEVLDSDDLLVGAEIVDSALALRRKRVEKLARELADRVELFTQRWTDYATTGMAKKARELLAELDFDKCSHYLCDHARAILDADKDNPESGQEPRK